ncbi:MAG: hypothetical protein Q8O40_14895, partial [Chloroflexota bacterium]|nr:hypothetical protein [Chloroflexota bacterium]
GAWATEPVEDFDFDLVFSMLVNLVVTAAMVAVVWQQLVRLMPVTATGPEEPSELPAAADIGQTHWNPEAQRLLIFLPDTIQPRTEIL